jgi:hypothetical protein
VAFALLLATCYKCSKYVRHGFETSFCCPKATSIPPSRLHLRVRAIPQGQDPPGAENGEQQSPPLIPPPPIGDEDIYTQVPNPEAGQEEEVIPPPAPNEAPSVVYRTALL